MSRRTMLAGLTGTTLAATFGVTGTVRAETSVRPTLLRNVKIFDGRSSTLQAGKNVLVEGNAIRALPGVGEAIETANAIDCGGRTIMPGLIDAHWHATLVGLSQAQLVTVELPFVHLVAAKQAELTLLRGFTTVRDVGGPSFALKRAIDLDIAVGPRIFPSGAMVSQTAGHADFRLLSDLPRNDCDALTAPEVGGVGIIADGADEVLRRTREQLMQGASQIKIMAGGGISSAYDPIDTTQYTEAEMRAAVEAAADWGTYVCTHVYTPKGIGRAIRSGVKCIEHGQLADEESVRRIADSGTWWSLQPFLQDEDANPRTTPQAVADGLSISEGTVRAYEMAKKHNARVAFGTDILFSPDKVRTQGKQLAKLARWFPADEVLRMATSRNAELLALSGQRNPYRGVLGAIEPGALADLLVVDGDPLENIHLIADPDKSFKLIMKGGRIYKNTLSG